MSGVGRVQWKEVWTRLSVAFKNAFQKYAERQSSRPEIRDGMELVPQPDDNASLCQCLQERPSREEL